MVQQNNLTLLPDDHPDLHKKSKLVNIYNDLTLHKTVEQMLRIMLEHNGIGLAAPQVGINKRLFIMYIDNSLYVCINPIIKRHSKDTSIDKEGCLSFPGVYLDIERHNEISVRYQNIQGQIIDNVFKGILARCYEHELDHLNGIVFTDRIQR